MIVFEGITKTTNDPLRSRRKHLSVNTLERENGSLNLFTEFLTIKNVQTGNLATEVTSWVWVNWNLVEDFREWMLSKGYAIGSVNIHLGTIKKYCKLAAEAGVIPVEAFAMIALVESVKAGNRRTVDANRKITRIGHKKSRPILISKQQANQLKIQPDTPQGRRDALMMCLFLDHALRASEVSLLKVDDIDLGAGIFTVYRPKTDIEQTFRMTPDTLKAARAYFEAGDAPAIGPLLRGSRKDGRLEAAGMTERALTARVCELGRRIGIARLSAHDCRHYWTTEARSNGTDYEVLQKAGGWKSVQGPLSYLTNRPIVNGGVKI